MKREVCCDGCANDWRCLGAFPGEELKIVSGRLKTGAFCDGCNHAFLPGEAAHCVSVFTSRNPYFRWEHDFLSEESS